METRMPIVRLGCFSPFSMTSCTMQFKINETTSQRSSKKSWLDQPQKVEGGIIVYGLKLQDRSVSVVVRSLLQLSWRDFFFTPQILKKISKKIYNIIKC
eukprot:TRINITY_DN37660_c0_g1_i2.p1 TRINITY_DN37660_c0_g1~~TRINITY_DN37660_c0_g1_i2.p1  ORF type:complete len:111 (+),score=0.45 TRINITY_DN37660_c0_g1_i2:39-335(+)